VGFLYTPNPRKRAGLAVEAAVAARAGLPDLRVRAFASKPPKSEGDLPDWIDLRIAPPQDEIPRIYAACDLWLFSSGAEGFGLPILEAMACRTPVLATRAGAAPDIVDGQNGVLLDGTPAAFVDEIRRFDAMPGSEWQSWSDAAWATARTYGWDQTVDRLLSRLGVDETVA
jgi:glycosyltransferase involved in cell wall biosynthesis